MRLLPSPWIVAVALLILLPMSGRADDTQDRCADAYVAAQRSRNSGQLRAAREQAVFCGQAACSAVVRNDCVSWARELEARIPTVTLDVQREDGQAPRAVSVRIDGVSVAMGELSRAIALDPGEHHIEAREAGGVPVEVQVRLVEGESARRVTMRLPGPPKATPLAPTRTRLRTASRALLGVGAAGLVSFGALASAGLLREGRLEDTCAPRCARNRADGIERLYLGADVALGLGIVSGSLALWLWRRDVRARTPVPRETLSLVPTLNGASLWFARRF